MPSRSSMRHLCLICILLLFVSFLVQAEESAPYPPPDEVKAAFLKLLDRPKVPADPQVASSGPSAKDNMLEEVLTIASEKKADGKIERVPILIVKQASDNKRR